MQTILGANGTIGKEVSKYLPQYTDKIRQVSRNPRKVNASDETVSADLLNYVQTEKAFAGSDVAYLMAGLKYETKVWKDQWPKIMRNTIDACKKHNCKLVFFDNVYAYGQVAGTMKEDAPFNPISKKGEIRARIATMLLDEIKAGNISGMIVRSADFYGPGVTQSMTYSTVTKRLLAGKSAPKPSTPLRTHLTPARLLLSWGIRQAPLIKRGMRLPAQRSLVGKTLYAWLARRRDANIKE